MEWPQHYPPPACALQWIIFVHTSWKEIAMNAKDMEHSLHALKAEQFTLKMPSPLRQTSGYHRLRRLVSGSSVHHNNIFFCVNPLTSVPAVKGRDEPWPFFHFWHHHFWPKLATSLINFCRRKISPHWCPDRVIGLMEPEICMAKFAFLKAFLKVF